MCLRSVHKLLLFLGGWALVTNTAGWTIQAHLVAHEHSHGHHEDHGGHHSHDEDHDRDSCGICQEFAKLSKQVPVLTAPVLSLDLPRILEVSRIPAAVMSRIVLTIGFPRAPPMTHP